MTVHQRNACVLVWEHPARGTLYRTNTGAWTDELGKASPIPRWLAEQLAAEYAAGGAVRAVVREFAEITR